MPNTIIFAFGLFVTSIFVAGVYAYIRIKFDQLEDIQQEKTQENELNTARDRVHVPIRIADHH